MSQHPRYLVVLTLSVLAFVPLRGCSSSDERSGAAGPGPAGAKEDPKGTKEKYMNQEADQAAPPVVVIETSMGTIKARLWADRTPKTVASFLRYVDEEFYDDVIFHRVIKGFMIQGGGMTADMRKKSTHESVPNEASREHRNDRGTLAMARTSDPHSASSQFFVNLVDNDFLNHRSKTADGWGYCAFGEVIEGMSVVDKIGSVKTASRNGSDDVPVEPVTITSIRRAD